MDINLFNIAKKFMDWLEKFYSLYQKYQDKFSEEEKKLISYNLFMAYIYVSDIIATGNKILDKLECILTINPHEDFGMSFVNSVSEKCKSCLVLISFSKKKECYCNIGHIIQQQIYNINKFLEYVLNMPTEIIVVDKKFLYELHEALSIKKGYLNRLLSDLEYGYLVKEFVELQIKESNKPRHLKYLYGYENSSLILINEHNKRIINNFFIVYKPKENLNKINKISESFKKKLEKIFDIQDILIGLKEHNENKKFKRELLHKLSDLYFKDIFIK